MTGFREILAGIEKPLTFASKNSFAHLANIKGLESTVRVIASNGRSHIDSGEMEQLDLLTAAFEGFDTLPLDEKRERVVRALEILNRLKDGATAQDTGYAVAPPPVPSSYEASASIKALSTPVQFLKKVGPKIGALLEKKGICTIGDLLYFIPRTYQDRREVIRMSRVTVGSVETVAGEVLAADTVGFKGGRKKVFEVMVGDGSGIMVGKWFHFNARYMKGKFKKGDKVVMTGEVRAFGGQREMHHPDIEPFDDTDKLNFGRIVPVYSLTEGLGEKMLRRIIAQALADHLDSVSDWLPHEAMKRRDLIQLREALKEAHFPSKNEEMGPLLAGRSRARRRLVFDEFFFLELGMALKHSGVTLEKGIPMKGNGLLANRLRELLPFSLTAAQERVIDAIKKDMGSPHPMNRLVQGDVGCGKTLVALTAVLTAVENGHQAVIMAPTELLAEQHFLNIHRYAEGLGVNIAILTGSIKGKEREAMLAGIRTGVVRIVVGTHALIQEAVEFSSLGLAVVDEQHRFGVVQRGILKKKGNNPHILVMTATPIPRTLAMTVYGDLDLSVIDEMPPGRTPVETKVYYERDRNRVYGEVRKEVSGGRQAYLVCPLVEESEKSELLDAVNMAERLREVFPEFRVGLLHGRMKSEEKEEVMRRFKERETDILVATTVIEVGIDVPNATVMVIEHAERFGLSQLHQLRGRVGRGAHKSRCMLISQYSRSEDAVKRLRIMEETADGFRIAEADLEIRGPGDFLGTRQSGLPDFRVANIIRDAKILEEAKEEAFRLVGEDPRLSRPEHAAVRELLMERWKGKLELAGIG